MHWMISLPLSVGATYYIFTSRQTWPRDSVWKVER